MSEKTQKQPKRPLVGRMRGEKAPNTVDLTPKLQIRPQPRATERRVAATRSERRVAATRSGTARGGHSLRKGAWRPPAAAPMVEEGWNMMERPR